MPRPRLLILCLLLGILTTIAIAWTLALWHSSPLAGFTLSILIDPNDTGRERAVYINQEARAGVRSVFFSTSAETPGSIGPSWSPVGGATTGTPFWTLKPVHRAAIDHIIVEFAKLNADDPSSARILPAWPSWLPDIPPTRDGLLSHGGRAAGWPFLTLHSTLNVDPITRKDHWTGSWRLIPIAQYQRPGRFTLQDPASGCVPLIPTAAFPLSAAMWAAAWLLLLGTPGLIRSARRRRTGRCANCGYDLRGTSPGSPCPESRRSLSAASPDTLPAMKRFFTATTPHVTGVGLLVLRIASGGFLAVGHGWSKLHDSNAGSFPDPLGIGHAASFYGAVTSEFLCGILVAIGLFTRLACLPCIFTMGVALALIHTHDPFFSGGGAAKEPAAIYAAMFLCILLCGPGNYSADHALFGRGGGGGGGGSRKA